MDLKIQHSLNVGILELVLEGSFNESTVFDDVPIKGVEEIYVDFNGVKFINSTGINKWVRWTQTLETDYPTVKMKFFNCPKVIVDQINAVKGFLPKNAKVESFWLPFYCDESDRREYVLLTRETDFSEEIGAEKQWVNIPECQCSESSTPCEPDIMPAKYFAFLKART